MATVKFYLRKKVLSDGTSPLVLKIYKDGVPSISHIGVNLKPEDWDSQKRRVRKTHPNSTRLNNFLLKRLSEATDTAIAAQTINNNVSSKTLIKKIKPNSGSSFFKYVSNFAANLKKAGKYDQRKNVIASADNFKSFLKGADIVFPDITVSLLERYRQYLAHEIEVGKDKKGMKPQSVLNQLSFIRQIFNQAIKEKDVDLKFYPFGKNGLKLKPSESSKVGLSADDVTLIEDVELLNSNYNHARNLWLISFYFGGMRAADVFRLKWSDFKDYRLHYTMGKNHKPGSLKATDKVWHILKQYEHDKQHVGDFIFPELKSFSDLNDEFLLNKFISGKVSATSGLLKRYVAPLAGINHKVTMHIARHTFGNIAGESGISLIMLQKIFRHSVITTTMKYMASFANKESDEALDTVLDFKPNVQVDRKLRAAV